MRRTTLLPAHYHIATHILGLHSTYICPKNDCFNLYFVAVVVELLVCTRSRSVHMTTHTHWYSAESDPVIG